MANQSAAREWWMIVYVAEWPKGAMSNDWLSSKAFSDENIRLAKDHRRRAVYRVHARLKAAA